MVQEKRALIISCFDTWYFNRIEPLYELMEDSGYKIRILVSDYHHIKKQYVANKNKSCTYVHVPGYGKNLSFTRIISHLVFGASVNKYLNSYKPDLIYLLVPPNNTATYCALYKKHNPACIYIVDVLDMWPESMPLKMLKHTPPAWIWAAMRDGSLRVADHIFTECGLYNRKLEKVLDLSKTSTLYLYKQQSEEEKNLVKQVIAGREGQLNGTRNKNISFAYLGSINNIVDIEGICSVLASFKGQGLGILVEVIGDGESREEFIRELKKTGARVNYHGAVYDEKEKIKILAPCDFAFNMMKETSQVGLTIKSMDYISYGLPLINNIKGDTWGLVEKYGIGINIGKNSQTKTVLIDHKRVLDIYRKKFTRDVFRENVRLTFSQLGI